MSKDVGLTIFSGKSNWSARPAWRRTNSIERKFWKWKANRIGGCKGNSYGGKGPVGIYCYRAQFCCETASTILRLCHQPYWYYLDTLVDIGDGKRRNTVNEAKHGFGCSVGGFAMSAIWKQSRRIPPTKQCPSSARGLFSSISCWHSFCHCLS